MFSGHLATNGIISPSYSVPDWGLADPWDGKIKYGRTYNAEGKAVLKVKIAQGEPLDAFNTRRLQIMGNHGLPSQQIPHGKPVWIAFAFRPSAMMLGGGLIFAQSASRPGDSGFYVYWGNSNKVTMGVWANTTPNGDRTTVGSMTNLGAPIQVQPGTWMYVVVQAKFHYDSAQGPYTKVWTKVGNGALSQYADDHHANAWNLPATGQWSFPRLGPYYFSGDPWGGVANAPDHDYEIAGMVVVPVDAVPGASANDLLGWLTTRTGG
ncbi:MAG: heparin lyase I family protein [Burkholderiaceae bacterium]